MGHTGNARTNKEHGRKNLMELPYRIVYIPRGCDMVWDRCIDDIPDAILNTQWFPDLCEADVGEKRLCAAILFDAIYVLIGSLPKDPATRKSIEHQRRRDLAWINLDDTTHTYSFVSLCDILGLQPEAVRSRIYSAMADKGRSASTTRPHRRYEQKPGLHTE